MNADPHDPLFRAFEAAAGRGAPARVPPGLLAFARRVVGAGRAALASEPCPPAAFRRAEALFGSPRNAAARLLALALDSWSGLAPATRGRGPRLLRYGDGTRTLDVELEPLPGGKARIRLALAPHAGLAVRVVQGRGGTAVALDAQGAGEALLTRLVRGARIELRRGRALVARTPALPGR